MNDMEKGRLKKMTPAKKNNRKRYVLIFLAVLIGFVVSQWSRNRSVEPYAESSLWEEQTPWQKYRTRKRLGLEGPASPESMLIIDMFQSRKPQDKTKHVDDAKPVE